MRMTQTLFLILMVFSILTIRVYATTDTIGGADGNDDMGTSHTACLFITASGSGTLQKIGINSYSSGYNVQLGIYSLASGEPSALLGNSIVATSTSGWNDLTIPQTVSITSSTSYAICFKNGGGTYYYSGTVSQRYDNSGIGTWSNPFSPDSSQTYKTFNMRMTYAAASTTTTSTSTSTTSITTTTSTSTTSITTTTSTSTTSVTTTSSTSTTSTTSTSTTSTTSTSTITSCTPTLSSSGTTDTIGATATTQYYQNVHQFGFPVVASASGTLQSVGLNIASTNGNAIALGIYSDSAGSPATFLGGTPATATTAGWDDFALTSFSIAITQGTKYWVTVQLGGGNQPVFNGIGSGSTGWMTTLSGVGTWATPFGGAVDGELFNMRMKYGAVPITAWAINCAENCVLSTASPTYNWQGVSVALLSFYGTGTATFKSYNVISTGFQLDSRCKVYLNGQIQWATR